MSLIDEAEKKRFIAFISLLNDPKAGTKKNPVKIKWLPWQFEHMCNIMCRVDAHGKRLVKESYVEVPRKQGKTTMLAAMLLYMLFMKDSRGQELYSAANSRDQASLIFNMMCSMIRSNPALMKRCRIYESKKMISRPDTESFFRALSADSSTAHGLNPSFVVYDELHEAKSRDLYDVLKTGMGAREEPLFVTITTAGEAPIAGNVCWELHEYARKIIEGSVENDKFYPVIYAASEDDDIYDEATWYKANPSLGYHRKIEEFREQARIAKDVPAAERAFKRLYLNMWIGSDDSWVSFSSWLKTAGVVDPEALNGRRCYAGLDLSSTQDITAFVLMFPMDGDDEYVTIPFFWIPQDKLLDRKDGVDYYMWSEQGYVDVCPGSVIDYKYIIHKIEALSKEYNIQEIAYDRWGAAKLRIDLEERGFTMVEFGQGYASMSPPMQELVRLVLDKNLAHGNNPVLNWMASNMVAETDAAGNIKPSKAKSVNKIDGMVALIMGLDRAIKWKQNANVYERRAPRSVNLP